MSKEKIKAIVSVALLVILGVSVKTFVVTTFWGWFIQPLIGINAPSTPAILGIIVMLTYIFPSPNSDLKNEDEEDPIINAVASIIASAIVSLAIGYIITLFI